MLKNSVVLGNRRELNRKDAKCLVACFEGVEEKSSSSSRGIMETSVLSLDGAVIFQRKEDNLPIGFKIGKNQPVPSLYYLWSCGGILPILYVNEFVSEYILNGAHLMLPGILTYDKYLSVSGRFLVGDLVTICVAGNPWPFAVGVAAMSCDEIYSSESGTKGKAVNVLHYFGDGLWQVGPKDIPVGFAFNKIVPPQNVPVVPVPVEVKPLTPPSVELMDKFIFRSFLFLCKSLSPSDFPMNASCLLSRIQAAGKVLSPDKFIDLKLSSHQKFSNLVTFLETHFIKTKMVQNELVILSLNFGNEQIRKFVPPPDKKPTTPINQLVSVWYMLSAKWHAAFPDWPLEGSRAELTKSLTELLRTVPGEFVDLPNNTLLATLLLSSEKNYKKKDVVEKFNNSLLPMYSLCSELPPRVRRGTPPKVTVHARRIQGNKFCTNISGLAAGYQIDESELASRISKLFAVTASVVEGKIYCQGNLAEKLIIFLVTKIGLPADVIEKKSSTK